MSQRTEHQNYTMYNQVHISQKKIYKWLYIYEYIFHWSSEKYQSKLHSDIISPQLSWVSSKRLKKEGKENNLDSKLANVSSVPATIIGRLEPNSSSCPLNPKRVSLLVHTENDISYHILPHLNNNNNEYKSISNTTDNKER